MNHHHHHEERQLTSGKNYMTAADYTPFLARYKKNNEGMVSIVPPCVYSSPIQTYFRNDTVKTNLHISTLAKDWDYCADIDYTSGVDASYAIYVALKGKYKILKYSGDTDGAIPTYGTQQWIKDLNWSVQEAWRPMMLDGQVAGYVEVHDGLTFVTIHGAGHMAPQWRRAPTYHAIFNFIKGLPL
jgi:hypothetical protein